MKTLILFLLMSMASFAGVRTETVGYAVQQSNGLISVYWLIPNEERPIPADIVKIRPWKSTPFSVSIIEFSGDSVILVDSVASFKLPARITRQVIE